MDEQQQWARVLSIAAAPSGPDRDAALRAAMGLGLCVAPDSSGCSVTELTDAGYRTTASANELAVAIDLGQYDADEGPCLVAATKGSVERLDNLARQSRFPALRPTAARHGVSSSLSLPLPGAGRPAALNLYAAAPAAFAAERPQAVAELLARCVAALLPGSSAPLPAPSRDVAVLRRRLEHAQELLMATEGLGRADAFGVLVTRSRREERSIFHVVDDLLRDAGRENAR